MFKKSLIIGSVTLIFLALLTLAGCSNPAGGNGPQGRDGTLVLEGSIDAGHLAEYFEDVHIIKLTGIGTVEGTVPAGKTLQIARSISTGAGGLTINGGTVHILDTGALNIAVGGGGRWISGSLVIEGDLVLDPSDDETFSPTVPGWVAFGASGAVDLQNAAPAVIDANFSYGVPAIKAGTTGLLTDLSLFPNWIGGRKLIAYNTQNINEVLDITGKGPLVIGTPNRDSTLSGLFNLNKATNQGAFLVSRGGGSVTVAENATLSLSATGWLPGNFPITVYGKLNASGPVEIDEIPPSVDLSQGTLTASGNPIFTFGPRGVNIGRIEMPSSAGDSITINGVPLTGGVRQTVTLNVGGITTTAAATLNLPAGTTTVDKIITGGGSLILGTSANGHQGNPAETVKAVLRPSIIAGASNVNVIRGARLELSGPIDLSNTLELDSENLGANWAAQLALITGGAVDIRGDHLVFTGGETLNTQLLNAGEVDLAGTVTFNRSANFAKVTVTGPATVNGRGTFAIAAGSSLLVNDDITFNIKGFGVDPGVALGGGVTSLISIKDDKSIILGADTRFAVGSALVLTEGQYKAKGAVSIVPNGTTVITALNEADKGLIVSPAGDTANTITLFSDGAAAAVFTATAGGGGEPVAFGKDGILIPAASTGTGAVFAVTGTATAGEITVAGTSAITLGTHTTATQKGTLSLLTGAILSAADLSPATPYTVLGTDTSNTTAKDFDDAIIATLTIVGDGTTGVSITTKAPAGDAKFTSTTKH